MENRTDLSEAEIAVHWQEEKYYHPTSAFIAQANLADEKVYERFSLDNFPQCFDEYAELLDWYKRWDKTLDTSNAPFWKWYVGGRINTSYNCVDRHLPKSKNKTAIHFVPELEDEAIRHVTYQELYVQVNEFAALLRDFCGLKAGDRATLHLPMVPELPIAMLACARLGVIHSQVFSGFSGKACADRIVDSTSRGLITMDAYYPNGTLQEHKQKTDIHSDDVYWSMADIGWITGHSCIVCGPLALGASSVIYEGVPTYPDAGRPWRIAEQLAANIFHTSPTAIRALRRAGPDEPNNYDYHFKHMTTVGEPIEPEVWRWYHSVVGKGEAVIVDTWGQTEKGGVLVRHRPSARPEKAP